jgi:hypothetical protein
LYYDDAVDVQTEQSLDRGCHTLLTDHATQFIAILLHPKLIVIVAINSNQAGGTIYETKLPKCQKQHTADTHKKLHMEGHEQPLFVVKPNASLTSTTCNQQYSGKESYFVVQSAACGSQHFWPFLVCH